MVAGDLVGGGGAGGASRAADVAPASSSRSKKRRSAAAEEPCLNAVALSVARRVNQSDEVGDAQKLPVKLWNNGVLCQDFNTDDMAHQIMRCVEFVTAVHALEAGDLIATGTSHGGLNAFMDGDKVELEIGPLGKLMINVKDDLKRTWGRETRHEMAEKGTPGPTPQLTGKYAKS